MVRKFKKTNRAGGTLKRSRLLKYTVGLVFILVVIILILELTNSTHIFHKSKIPQVIPVASTTSQNSKPAASNENTSQQQNAATSTSSSKSASLGGGNTDTNLPLTPPYGDFVSNHHPTPNTSMDEVSVCNTTPGAACYIRFSNGQNTTQLPSQTVGGDGSSSWNWNVSSDAHLTSGQWLVTAVATLNGQTKSTDDSLKLVVP